MMKIKIEKILNILSGIIVAAAILAEIYQYKKETGEFSIHSWLMNRPVPVNISIVNSVP